MFEYEKIIITDVHLFVSQYYKIYIKPNPINLRGGFLEGGWPDLRVIYILSQRLTVNSLSAITAQTRKCTKTYKCVLALVLLGGYVTNHRFFSTKVN